MIAVTLSIFKKHDVHRFYSVELSKVNRSSVCLLSVSYQYRLNVILAINELQKTRVCNLANDTHTGGDHNSIISTKYTKREPRPPLAANTNSRCPRGQTTRHCLRYISRSTLTEVQVESFCCYSFSRLEGLFVRLCNGANCKSFEFISALRTSL
jgi:hypothetical protein